MTEQPVEAGRLHVEVVSEVSGFRRELQAKLDAELRGLRAKVAVEVAGKVEFDRAQIRRELATKLFQAARDIKVKVSVEADLTRARSEVERFRREQERRPIRPPVRPQTDEQALRRVAQRLSRFGGTLTSVLQPVALASGLTLAAGAVVNLAGGVGALAASAAQAAGVGAALPGIYATAGQAIGAFKLGISGVGDAVKQLQKEADKKAGLTPLQQAMANLSPEGRKLARTIASDVLPAFEKLRFSVQDAVAPHLRTAIRTAMPLLGTLRAGLTDTGRRVGGLTVEFARLAAAPPFRRDMGTVMASNNRAMTDFGRAGIHLTSALRHVLVVAGPLVERIAALALRLSKAAEASAGAGRESGRMAAYFDRAWATATKLGRILVDVGAGLGNVFRLGRPTGDTLLDDLAAAAERFRKATEDPANAERIQRFFEQTTPVMRQFGDLLVRVTALLLRLGEATGGGSLDGLFMVLNALVTVLEKIASMPGGGQVLSTIFLLAGAGAGIGLVAKALGGIVANLGTLAKFTGLAKLFEALGGGGGEEGGGGPLERLKAGWDKVREGFDRLKQGVNDARAALTRMRQAAVQAAQQARAAVAAGGRRVRSGAQAAGRGVRRGAQAAGRGARTAAVTVGRGTAAAAQAAARALTAAAVAAGRAARAAAVFAANMARAAARGVAAGVRAAGAAIASTAAAAGRAAASLGALALSYVRAGAAAALAAARTVLFTAAQVAVRAATIAWTAVQWLLNAALVANPIGLIVAGIALLIGAVVLAYNKIGWFRDGVNAAFAFLKNAVVATIGFVRDHWKLILAVVLGPLGILIGQVASHWRQIYDAVAKAVDWVVGFVRSHWQLLIAIVLGPLGVIVGLVIKNWDRIRAVTSAAVAAVLSVVRSRLEAVRSAVSSALSAIGGIFQRGWSSVVSRTTSLASSLRSKISSLMSALRSAFTSGVSAMGRAWDRLREATKKPINAFIGFYNRGVVGLWNRVMGWLKISGLRLGQVGLLARGGTLANPANAAPMVTNKPMAIVGEGRPAHPEYVIPTDPRYRGRAQALWAAAGAKLDMMAGGGVLGGILGGVKKAAGRVLEIGKAGLDLIADPGRIWDRLAGSLLSQASGIGTSPYAQVIAAIPKHLLDTARGAALQIIKAFKAGFGGGGNMGVVNAARTQIGVPYVWGGTSWGHGLDCSGLTMMSWLKGANKNITRTTYTQRQYMRTIPGPRPGAVGQPHAGHTYLASRVQGGRTWVVEAQRTGTRISEHPLTRSTPWWGWPPGMAAGGVLQRLGERFVKSGDEGSLLAKFLGVAGDPGGVVEGFPGPTYRRDRGGPLPPGSFAYNGLRGTEWVLTPEAVDLLGGDRAVAALNAHAQRLRSSRPAASAPRTADSAPAAATVNVYPQPRQSEHEIGMVAARKLGAMLA